MASHSSALLTSHRAIREALSNAGKGSTLLVSGDSPRLEQLVEKARSNRVAVRRISRDELRSAAPEAHDCALEFVEQRRAQLSLEEVVGRSEASSLLLLVLDHVTDPQNYGAILRSADQFAVDAVVVAGRRSAPLSAAAIQASAGTAHHVPVITVTNLASAVELMKERNVWVYAADMEGEQAHRSNLSGRVAVVMGSEGKGVSRLVADRSDGRLRIPMGGHADSLNVSVACGVMLYEVRRQQGWLDAH